MAASTLQQLLGGRRNSLSNYTLPTHQITPGQFNPTTFNPIVYEAKEFDTNKLVQSMAQLEARQEKAAEQQTAIDVSLGKIESELHDDVETKSWFENYKQNVKDKIQNEVDAGNYGSAIKLATKMAGDVANDQELQGRLKTQQQWKEADKIQENRMLSGKISKSTLNWWRANGGQYRYKPTTDAQGNIIGSEDFESNTPVDDIDYSQLAHTAFQLISASRTAKSTSTSTSSYTDGTGGSKSSSSGSSLEKVTRQEILDNIRNILDATPDGYKAVEQSYEVYRYETQQKIDEIADLQNRLLSPDLSDLDKTKLTNELKSKQAQLNQRRKMITAPNGQTITDYATFFANMIENNMFAEGLAYERTSTESSSSTANQTTTKDPLAGLTKLDSDGTSSHTRFYSGPYSTDYYNTYLKGKGPSVVFKSYGIGAMPIYEVDNLSW